MGLIWGSKVGQITQLPGRSQEDPAEFSARVRAGTRLQVLAVLGGCGEPPWTIPRGGLGTGDLGLLGSEALSQGPVPSLEPGSGRKDPVILNGDSGSGVSSVPPVPLGQLFGKPGLWLVGVVGWGCFPCRRLFRTSPGSTRHPLPPFICPLGLDGGLRKPLGAGRSLLVVSAWTLAQMVLWAPNWDLWGGFRLAVGTGRGRQGKEALQGT